MRGLTLCPLHKESGILVGPTRAESFAPRGEKSSRRRERRVYTPLDTGFRRCVDPYGGRPRRRTRAGSGKNVDRSKTGRRAQRAAWLLNSPPASDAAGQETRCECSQASVLRSEYGWYGLLVLQYRPLCIGLMQTRSKSKHVMD